MGGFDGEKLPEGMNMEDADVSDFQQVVVVHSFFVKGGLMPLEVLAMEDEEGWDELQDKVTRFCQKIPGVKIVGQSQMLALN